jgi:hypothetical protein
MVLFAADSEQAVVLSRVGSCHVWHETVRAFVQHSQKTHTVYIGIRHGLNRKAHVLHKNHAIIIRLRQMTVAFSVS